MGDWESRSLMRQDKVWSHRCGPSQEGHVHVCTEGMRILVYTTCNVHRYTVMGFNCVCPHGLG